MLPVWRLTRNRVARGTYLAFKRLGVTAARLTEYVRGLEGLPSAVPHTVILDDHETALALDAPVQELIPGERVVVAMIDEEPAGYLFVSVDPSINVRALEQELVIDGVYVRRIYVSQDCRRRGVAGALLRRACEWGRGRGAEQATAFVALGNGPAGALLEGKGFEPRRVRSYVRLGDRRRRWVTAT